MLFRPLLGTDLSGSVGGITASHNRGGAYFRNRAIPVNPNTPFQMAVRASLSQLTSLWVNVLTQPQRNAWDLYALNVPLPNPLGEPRNVGGLGMYIRTNVFRLQQPIARQDTAPAIFDLGSFTTPTIISITAATGILSLGFTPADAWANEAGGVMGVYASRSQNPSINFFKGPYRFAAAILGDPIPPTSPAAITLPFATVVGQRVFIRVATERNDGRLASSFRDFGTAV